MYYYYYYYYYYALAISSMVYVYGIYVVAYHIIKGVPIVIGGGY